MNAVHPIITTINPADQKKNIFLKDRSWVVMIWLFWFWLLLGVSVISTVSNVVVCTITGSGDWCIDANFSAIWLPLMFHKVLSAWNCL